MDDRSDINERLRARLEGVAPGRPPEEQVAPPEAGRRQATPEALSRFEGFVEPVAAIAQPLPRVPERRVYRVLTALALLALLVAVLMSWVTPDGHSLFGREVVAGKASVGATEPAGPPLPKGPGTMLPDNVLAYETIDLHLVPGTSGLSSEAIYQTYNMNSLAMAATVVYARVDGYASEAAARQGLEALLAKYPLEHNQVSLKEGIVATLGYAKNRRIQVCAWQKGRYVTWVKTSFTNPANGVASVTRSQALLQQIGNPIYRTVAIFQTRNLQGVQANTFLFGKTNSVIPSSTLDPVDPSLGDPGK